MDDNLENNPQKISENKKNENAVNPNPSDKPKVGTTSSAKSKESEENSSKIDNKQLFLIIISKKIINNSK